ncbi:hypothetical protein Stsp01_43200 [Streptomyces sp. NBRC 13847]|nr:hypothetical protein Stsp01_43200 [Streptomyces sp. NBRC 13847]
MECLSGPGESVLVDHGDKSAQEFHFDITLQDQHCLSHLVPVDVARARGCGCGGSGVLRGAREGAVRMAGAQTEWSIPDTEAFAPVG